MSAGSCRFFLAACLLAAGPLRAAEPASGPKSALRSELSRLVRSDARQAQATVREPLEGQGDPSLPNGATAPEAAPTDFATSPSTSSANVTTEHTVTLAPMVVEERIPPLPRPPRESRVEEFFRTGVIAEHVGKKVTTRFWIKGDRGIMLTFLW